MDKIIQETKYDKEIKVIDNLINAFQLKLNRNKSDKIKDKIHDLQKRKKSLNKMIIII